MKSKRDLKVTVVSPPASVWGAQLYLLDQVGPLAERGVELRLASPPGTPFSDAWEERGFPLIPVDLELHEGLRQPGSSARPGLGSLARSARGVFSAVKAISGLADDADVLYSFALRSHLDVAFVGRRTKTPVGLDLVNIVRPGLGRKALRLASRLATLTVANSRASAEVLGDAGEVEIVHPGIDLSRFHAAPADQELRAELAGGHDRPLVAIIGRIDVRKGVQVLVEAMSQLEGDAAAARLIVVGDAGTGPQEFADRLKQEATELLGDRVLFTGRRSDIPDVLRAVDCLVVASASEPFGLTALEAQACRIPVIGTRSGGLVEFVEHDVSGVLVPPFEPEPLARAIERVLTDHQLVQSIVDEAERRAVPDRGLDAQYDRWAGIFRQIAGQPAPAPAVSGAAS